MHSTAEPNSRFYRSHVSAAVLLREAGGDCGKRVLFSAAKIFVDTNDLAVAAVKIEGARHAGGSAADERCIVRSASCSSYSGIAIGEQAQRIKHDQQRRAFMHRDGRADPKAEDRRGHE